MVDKESESYRPRRAFVDPDAGSSSADEPTPPAPGPEVPKNEVPKNEVPKNEAPKQSDPLTPPPVTPPVAGDPSFPTLGPLLDDDAPKPLFRDEVRPADSSATERTPAGPTRPPTDQRDDTSTRQINFAPRRNRFFDDEETTVLPRSRATTRREVIDDHEDDENDVRPSGNPRLRTGLLIGAVAAITVIGLAIAYAVGVGRAPEAGPGPATSSSASAPATPTSSTDTAAPTDGQVLTGEMLLTPAQAASVSSQRTWTVDRTDTEPAADGPVPACLGGDPVEGVPTAQQQMSQLLASNGKQPYGILHQASAYASPEEAAQAYVVAAKALGTCAVAGSYIARGSVVTGVGDQATGVVVNVVNGSETQAHAVVLSQTGRVVNIMDAIREGKALPSGRVAEASAAVVGEQCAAAGGGCGGTPEVKAGPPPLGGDEPGYLAVGDLPPAGKTSSLWTADAVGAPQADFLGSGCEVVNFDTLSAESKFARTYLYTDSGDAFFGVNEIVLTLKDTGTAEKLAKKITGYVDDCKKRKLTATIVGPDKVSGPGSQNSTIAGSVFTVTQKSTKGPQKYRVGIVSTGSKVIYTFSNPKGDFDFTDGQWKTIALRAGERYTQIS